MAKFSLSKRSNGEFQFNLVAGNGEKILHSEGYTGKDGCLNGIDSVRRHAQTAANFNKKTAKDGSPYFALMASNGQSIGKSEMYTSVASRDKGIASVMRNAADARVVDATG